MRLKTYKDPLAEVAELSLRDVLPGLVPDIVLEVYRFGHHRFMNAVLAAQRDPDRKTTIKEMFREAGALTAESGEQETADRFMAMLGELRDEIPMLIRDARGLEFTEDDGTPIEGTRRLSSLQGEEREAVEEELFGRVEVRAAVVMTALSREAEFQSTVEAVAKNSSASSRTSAGKSPAKPKKSAPPAAN